MTEVTLCDFGGQVRKEDAAPAFSAFGALRLPGYEGARAV